MDNLSKTIGVAVLMLSCSWGGLMLSGSVKRHIKELDALLLFMKYILASLEKAGMDTLQIYRSFAEETLVKNGMIDMLIENTVHGARGENPWSQAVYEKLQLSAQEAALAVEFGGHIGSGALWNQLTYCRSAYERLKMQASSAVPTLKKQAELYRWLGILVGALVSLLLY